MTDSQILHGMSAARRQEPESQPQGGFALPSVGGVAFAQLPAAAVKAPTAAAVLDYALARTLDVAHVLCSQPSRKQAVNQER